MKFLKSERGIEMDKILIWSVVVVVVITFLASIDYYINCKKIYDKTKDDLYQIQDKGEGIWNVLSTVFLSAVFYILSMDDVRTCVVISAILSMLVLSIEQSCRIYRYKKQIRALEKAEQMNFQHILFNALQIDDIKDLS